MVKRSFVGIAVLTVSFMASGCVVRTYQVSRDRVDQELGNGNRGYLAGALPAAQETPVRTTTRDSRVVEVELKNPFHFSKKAKPDTEVPVPAAGSTEEGQEVLSDEEVPSVQAVAPKLQPYTVQKNETLQKISQKLYGTTKKWSAIFDANKDILKAPNKIYPGQVINVPVFEGMVQSQKQENLK